MILFYLGRGHEFHGPGLATRVIICLGWRGIVLLRAHPIFVFGLATANHDCLGMTNIL